MEYVKGFRTIFVSNGIDFGFVNVAFITDTWDKIPPIVETPLADGEYFIAYTANEDLSKKFITNLPFFKISSSPQISAIAEAICNQIEEFVKQKRREETYTAQTTVDEPI